MSRYAFKLFLVLNFAFLFQDAFSSNFCLDKLYQSVRDKKMEASVELEMDVDFFVMDLLTTEDGLVGEWSRMDSLDPILTKKYGGLEKLKSMPWDRVEYKDKISIINGATEKQIYLMNNKIPKLRVKDKLTVKFKSRTNFFGKVYSKGKREIDLSEIMLPQVEFRSPSDPGNLKGIEVHFREKGKSAGQISQNARDLSTYLNGVDVAQHVHITAPIPYKRIKGNPVEESLKMTDFYRRVNLIAEMDSIFSNKRISQVKSGIVTMFDSIKSSDLSKLAKVIKRRFSSNATYPLKRYRKKFGYAGIAMYDFYDTKDLWGIEYRSIHNNTSPAIARSRLDAIQYAMANSDYGISDEVFKNWKDNHVKRHFWSPGKKSYYEAVSDMYYNAGAKSIEEKLPFQFKKILEEYGVTSIDYVLFENEYKDHKDLLMLLHDWSDDVMLFGKEGAKDKVLEAQAKAIKSFQDKGKYDIRIMQNFLKESGLHDLVKDSLRVNGPGPS